MEVKDRELTPETRRQLNRLAREELKHRILADILTDIQICELEGWSYTEYIEELIDMLVKFKKES